MDSGPAFAIGAAEQTDYGREVAEMALAHVVENKVEAAYRRGDLYLKRKALMADWARYCEQEHVPGEIVPLAGHAPQAA